MDNNRVKLASNKIVSALMKVVLHKACLTKISHNTRVTNCQVNSNSVKETLRMGLKSKLILRKPQIANLTAATVEVVKMSMAGAEANLIASLCSSNSRSPKV